MSSTKTDNSMKLMQMIYFSKISELLFKRSTPNENIRTTNPLSRSHELAAEYVYDYLERHNLINSVKSMKKEMPKDLTRKYDRSWISRKLYLNPQTPFYNQITGSFVMNKCYDNVIPQGVVIDGSVQDVEVVSVGPMTEMMATIKQSMIQRENALQKFIDGEQIEEPQQTEIIAEKIENLAPQVLSSVSEPEEEIEIEEPVKNIPVEEIYEEIIVEEEEVQEETYIIEEEEVVEIVEE